MSPMEFIDQSVIPVTQNLIAAAICAGVAMLLSRNKEKIGSVKNVATTATSTIWKRHWRVILRLIGLWFVITEARSLVSAEGLPSRLDVALIALWVSVGSMIWFSILFGHHSDSG